MLNRLIINICTDDLVDSKAFYTSLFDLTVAFDSDWYIQLHGPKGQLELGLILKGHAVVPEGIASQSDGYYLTFVVDDVDAIYAKAKAAGYEVVEPPVDTFYGQRRLLLRDPNGAVVDVSAPIAGFQG